MVIGFFPLGCHKCPQLVVIFFLTAGGHESHQQELRERVKPSGWPPYRRCQGRARSRFGPRGRLLRRLRLPRRPRRSTSSSIVAREHRSIVVATTPVLRLTPLRILASTRDSLRPTDEPVTTLAVVTSRHTHPPGGVTVRSLGRAGCGASTLYFFEFLQVRACALVVHAAPVGSRCVRRRVSSPPRRDI